jgi:hypothetical protein
VDIRGRGVHHSPLVFSEDHGMPTTPLMEARVIEGLRALPRERVEEVCDFVDFLVARESTRFLAGRLTESLAALEAIELPLLLEDELLAVEIEGAGRHPPGETFGRRTGFSRFRDTR